MLRLDDLLNQIPEVCRTSNTLVYGRDSHGSSKNLMGISLAVYVHLKCRWHL